MLPSGEIRDLLNRARGGDGRAVARLLTHVEHGSEVHEDDRSALAADGRDTHVIGITGPPGAGKSTTTSALITELRQRGQRVGVLAVDPTSPLSGGALLGDRIRMQRHGDDPGVFVRSLASRGRLGGVSAATPRAIRVLAASSFDTVLVETVGVGQSEVEIAQLVDTTVVLTAPGLGDGIQAAKAGLLEMADLFVVNKADREGAEQVRRDLQSMISWGRGQVAGEWRTPILMTVGTTGQGIDALMEEIARHREWMQKQTDIANGRRLRLAQAEVEAALLRPLTARLDAARASSLFDELVAAVAGGELDAWSAADALIGE